jgi:phospholipid/cholesterol/gamma-HCH transport system permease protein
MNLILSNIGAQTIAMIEVIGRFVLFFLSSAKITKNFSIKQVIDQIVHMWIRSMPLIGMTAVFTGAVLALQSYTGFSRMHAESSIASIVVISITRELGPVISGLMFTGRIGSSIAAEIGTMRVSDQIDALEMLGVQAKTHLVTPRLIAGLISLPLLVLCADILGVFGGYLVAINVIGFESTAYLVKTLDFVHLSDITSGLVKSVFFGLAICSMGCYNGYNASRGAQGVGRATTLSVVSGAISVLALNYIITSMMFGK